MPRRSAGARDDDQSAERLTNRFYDAPIGEDARRSAPAASRNVGAIGGVLADWLPERGRVLEIASGTGEHCLSFARRFPKLDWQPSDRDAQALASISAWCADGPANLLPVVALDASSADWPVDHAAVILAINLVHISPWGSAIGLIDGARRILPLEGALILYGPWLEDEVATAPSNFAFDADLRARDFEWGLRRVSRFVEAAGARSLFLDERRSMPANNIMLRFVRG